MDKVASFSIVSTGELAKPTTYPKRLRVPSEDDNNAASRIA